MSRWFSAPGLELVRCARGPPGNPAVIAIRQQVTPTYYQPLWVMRGLAERMLCSGKEAVELAKSEGHVRDDADSNRPLTRPCAALQTGPYCRPFVGETA